MSSKNNKVIRIEKYRTMITGVQTNVGTKATIGIRGTVTAQPVIVSTLQGYIDAADATAAALAAYREAVARQKLAAVAANGTYLGVKAYALAQYGNVPSTLGEFGLQVPVRKTPVVATKAAANAKRTAKRTAKTAGATPAATPAPAGSGVTTTTKS
jgi:septal ring-binding cell division protein DamX